MQTAPKSYTFYSYKGGSGRSTTAINTLNHLIGELDAGPEHPVLLVDTDLESAGITYFFNCEKKFTDLLDSSIHTTGVLSGENGVLSSVAAASALFGSSSLIEEINRDVIHDLAVIDTGNTSDIGLLQKAEASLNELFDGIRLPRRDLNNLEIIAKSCRNIAERLDVSNKANEIKRLYDISGLILKLRNVNKNTRAAERTEEKKKCLTEFLPSSHFVDISSYFENCRPGTVMFLGADVHYQGQRMLRNDATNAMQKLIDACGDNGYAAVVFDSGAGVQSTANALNQISDVLVYCMRPTTQFIKGTRVQLSNYREALKVRMEERDENNEAGIVILLPTAVPMGNGNEELRNAAFDEIRKIIEDIGNKELVDSTFCAREMVLNEVEVFKWKEQILTEKTVVNPDEKKAYQVYKQLAAKMAELSGKNYTCAEEEE